EAALPGRPAQGREGAAGGGQDAGGDSNVTAGGAGYALLHTGTAGSGSCAATSKWLRRRPHGMGSLPGRRHTLSGTTRVHGAPRAARSHDEELAYLCGCGLSAGIREDTRGRALLDEVAEVRDRQLQSLVQ